MQVRRKLRRVKRLVYLGAFTGTVISIRRIRSRPAAGHGQVGSPASWPPLQPDAAPPVAAIGDVAATPASAASTPATAPADAPRTGDEPVAAVGALGDTNVAGRGADGNGDTARSNVTEAAADAEATDTATWIAPVDGSCPASHPIKANANSGIYHQPGGRFYERTHAERCYADPAAAEADGFRAAKDR